MITRQQAGDILAAALSRGGDMAELFYEDVTENSLKFTGGRAEDAAYSRRCGGGVRLLDGERHIYAYSAGEDVDSLMSAARRAADAKAGERSVQVAPFRAADYRSAPLRSGADTDNAARADILRAADSAARAVSGEITQVTASVADYDQQVLIANSEGVFSLDRRFRVRLRTESVAGSGAQAQTGVCAPGRALGYEAFEGEISPEECGDASARQAVIMLHAQECPSGVFPVVIAGGFGGVIFHEACGHLLETTCVSRGNSVFCGMLGKQIASERVTAYDDGTIPREWGSASVDDEGAPQQKRLLIEKGILRGYMTDILGARSMGSSATGSARRESYCFAPTSRMSNTYIAAGEDDPREMIASTQQGLIARSLGGGSVNPLTGEFNFAVSEGYWISEGRIIAPVRGASLIGRGAEVLMKIDRVGPEMWLAAGMCGSSSGMIPVNVGQPWIRVQSMTVGGKGGML